MEPDILETMTTDEQLSTKLSIEKIIRTVNVYSPQEAMDNVAEMLTGRDVNHIVTLNVESAMAIRRDPSNIAVLDTAEMVTPDSSGIVWALKELQGIDSQRVGGVDLAEAIFQRYPRQSEVTFFFLGSSDTTRKQAATNLSSTFNIAIAGEAGGYYGRDDEEIIQAINEADPTIIIMAGVAPKAEMWIHRHKSQLPASCRIMMNTGQGINIWGGSTQRAPELWQEWKLEWLYRLMKDPSGRIKRQLGTLPPFALEVMKEKFGTGATEK